MAILGGSYFNSRIFAVFIPIMALWISDLALGFHSTMLFVYGAIGLIALAASWNLKSSSKWPRLIGFSFMASLFFFLLTNFGIWYVDAMYPKTASGLLTCYEMALPFLGTQILGDLLYTGLLFGALKWLQNYKPESALKTP
jgi:hypothetical protein